MQAASKNKSLAKESDLSENLEVLTVGKSGDQDRLIFSKALSKRLKFKGGEKLAVTIIVNAKGDEYIVMKVIKASSLFEGLPSL